MREVEIIFKAHITPSDEQIIKECANNLKIKPERITSFEVIKKSLDARGGDIKFRYRVNVSLQGEPKIEPYKLQEFKCVKDSDPVIVIGAGPAGLFASLKLIQKGLKPVVLERGKDVHARKFDMAKLSREGIVNPDSNYCFGEGGAGTFSDGKLYTRSTKKGDIKEVLNLFVKFGANPNILIESHAHIGSDKLPDVIESIRNFIIEQGGEVHFNSKVVDLIRDTNKWDAVVEDLTNNQNKIIYSAKNVILATGHSARDIYRLFKSKNWDIEAKGFALGVRVEHPQSLINNIQYHGKYQPFMPTAEYSLVAQVDGRGVFSFCMCPGGILVPASTNNGELVLNGMSNSQRNSKWANSGVVVSINPEDIPHEFSQYQELKVLKFQEWVEQQCYRQTNSLKAPAQRMEDFVRGKVSVDLPQSSYHPGVYSADLYSVLPDFVACRLKKAFIEFNKKMKGYLTNKALLLAVESRTSSPVRIPRDKETLEHISLPGIYPCGEGAGYAGGIVSSALDGINCAIKIAEK